MAEHPPRSCGNCPLSNDYSKIVNVQGDYLQHSTVPQPEIVPKGKVGLNEKHLGVTKTFTPPDIQAPQIPPNNIIINTEPNEGYHNQQKMDCCCKDDERKTAKERCPETPYKKAEWRDPSFDIQQPGMPRIDTEKTDLGVLRSIEPESPIKGILKKKTPCACEKSIEHSEDTKTTLDNKSTEQKPKDDEVSNRVCYLPKPEDDFPDQREDDMGALGPWATGRLDWGPLAGLTGVRPVVDKYSVARFSEGEWRAHNKEVLDLIVGDQHKANLLDYNAKEGMESTRMQTDKNQADTNKRLQQREMELHRWKCELERAISASAEEITALQDQRRRLKMSMAVLQLPESIAGECLERRTGRLDQELVRDEVEEELIKEMALTAEIRDQFTRTLADVEHQLLEDKTAKSRLEYDWSDKKQANEIECINVALTNHSTVNMFKPGSVAFPDNQSSHEYYEKFTRETLEESEITRQRSVALRGTLDAILTDAGKNLRAQADRVDMALAKRIACTEEIRLRLENELRSLLKRLADIESTVCTLRDMIRRMDCALKLAQTRLNNRQAFRPRVENCRDAAQYGLVEEARNIGDNVAALNSQLNQAEDTQNSLMRVRGDLEREIMVKRKTLEIDRDRIKVIRSHYPSATALSGY